MDTITAATMKIEVQTIRRPSLTDVPRYCAAESKRRYRKIKGLKKMKVKNLYFHSSRDK